MNSSWKVRGREVDLTAGMIMGVVNVTPDSFSDGGRFLDTEAAVAHGMTLAAEGAEILDIGGESTRPGAEPVPGAEELRRVLPVIEKIRAELPEVLLSIDTSKPQVAAAAIAVGADIINDVNALRAEGMLELAAESGVGIVLMHMQGTPESMQLKPGYGNVLAEVQAFFAERLETAKAAGIDIEAILLDPGIGFGKRLKDNLALIRRLPELELGGRPLLVGVSRKSFMGVVLDSTAVADREWPTIAITSLARERGARVFRVHSVRPNVEALRMSSAIVANA